MNAFVKVLESPICGFDIVFVLQSGSEVRYSSVFCRREDAEAFAERANRLGISEIHIPEVIEDAIL